MKETVREFLVGKAPSAVLGRASLHPCPRKAGLPCPPLKGFSYVQSSHFLLTPFLFPQVISMVMVAVGVYARLMKHAGGLQVSLPLHTPAAPLLAPTLALG